MSDQRVPKMSFLGFQQKSNHLYVLVLLEYESTNSLLTFCKYHIWEKSCYGSKTFRSVRMQDSLK